MLPDPSVPKSKLFERLSALERPWENVSLEMGGEIFTFRIEVLSQAKTDQAQNNAQSYLAKQLHMKPEELLGSSVYNRICAEMIALAFKDPEAAQNGSHPPIFEDADHVIRHLTSDQFFECFQAYEKVRMRFGVNEYFIDSKADLDRWVSWLSEGAAANFLGAWDLQELRSGLTTMAREILRLTHSPTSSWESISELDLLTSNIAISLRTERQSNTTSENNTSETLVLHAASHYNGEVFEGEGRRKTLEAIELTDPELLAKKMRREPV